MITEKKVELKLKSREDLEGTLVELETSIGFASKLFNECILLGGRLKDLKEAYMKDTISRPERGIELAKIRGALLSLIDKLTVEDFKTLEDTMEEIIEDTGMEYEDDLGFYDFVEIAENDLLETTDSITNLAVYSNRFGQELEEQAEKIMSLNNSRISDKQKVTKLKYLVANTTKFFVIYNDQLATEIRTFENKSNSSLDSLYKAVELIYSDNLQAKDNELEEIYQSVNALEKAIGESRIGLMSMYTSIKQLPRIEKGLNKAKKITEGHMENLFQKLEGFREKTRKFLDYMELNLRELKE